MYYLFCYHQSVIFKGQSYNEVCHYILNSIKFSFVYYMIMSNKSNSMCIFNLN